MYSIATKRSINRAHIVLNSTKFTLNARLYASRFEAVGAILRAVGHFFWAFTAHVFTTLKFIASITFNACPALRFSKAGFRVNLAIEYFFWASNTCIVSEIVATLACSACQFSSRLVTGGARILTIVHGCACRACVFTAVEYVASIASRTYLCIGCWVPKAGWSISGTVCHSAWAGCTLGISSGWAGFWGILSLATLFTCSTFGIGSSWAGFRGILSLATLFTGSTFGIDSGWAGLRSVLLWTALRAFIAFAIGNVLGLLACWCLVTL